ncbi:hypothetical protein [Aestuariivirga sp.]|uniref:hypothetical protein n=1 Tax=Aestuariivirga sp. TaxID=2650926 RepID=UPI0035B04809
MLNVSNSPSSVMWLPAGSGLPSPSSLNGDTLYMLVLRFAGHFSYFKVASMLLLPQGLSNGGVVVATAVYSLACLVASRWIAGLRRVAEAPHPAALPLLGATAVFIAMMAVGPAIATLLPRHPDWAVTVGTMVPAWLCLLAPVIAGFFAAQYLTRPRRRVV